jgi:hypothetical protein
MNIGTLGTKRKRMELDADAAVTQTLWTSKASTVAVWPNGSTLLEAGPAPD